MRGYEGRTIEVLLDDLVERGETAQRIVARRTVEEVAEQEIADFAPSHVVPIVGEIAGRLARLHPELTAALADEDLGHADRMRNRLCRGDESVTPPVRNRVARDDVARLAGKARRWRSERDDRP